MSLASHLDSLNTKVNNIDMKIHEAYVHHQDTASLKKQRLLYLDAIEQLTSYNDKSAA
jgi:hypothetical protein